MLSFLLLKLLFIVSIFPSSWIFARGKSLIGLNVSLLEVCIFLTFVPLIARQKLSYDEPIPEFRVDELPLSDVMDTLQDLSRTNMSVDWTDLTDNGVNKDKPISLRVANLSMRTVLKQVLAQAGGGDTMLGFQVNEGLLRVATKSKLDRDKSVLVYDIRDLLVNIPRVKREGLVNMATLQGGDVSTGRSLFNQAERQSEYAQAAENGGQANPMVGQLMDILRQTVEPDSWRETGGGDGSLRELNGQLIVYNTSEAHRQVVDLLTQLRETRALQISVECRFLNVVSNFLEQFGVDLDFVFNSGSAGYDQVLGPTGAALTDPATGAPVLVPRPYSRIGRFATPPVFGEQFSQLAPPLQPYNRAPFVPPDTGNGPVFSEMTPITARQGALELADPGRVSTGVPGTYGTSGLQPALSIAGSFLDNLQVDFLIRATQANARSSVVQAPRIVLFNGQASAITVGRGRAYVSSLRPQLAEGAVGFQPIIAVAQSGVYMYVEATISADRRYVTLSLLVQQAEEPSFERFQITQASGNSPGSFVLLPDIRYTNIETTVSVPDGGTVLLGGLKQVGEVEIEAGVPILSKIPVLKRAFSNQSTVKDTRTLLVLIRTKIIIQKETEEEAFPTFTRVGG